MATYFARASAALSTAIWATTPTGTGATLASYGGLQPTDVLMSNSFTVTIDQSITCAELRNDAASGATVGGGFNCSYPGITINATLPPNAGLPSLTTTNTSGVISIVAASITGGASNETLRHNGAGTLQVSVAGDISGGVGLAGMAIGVMSGTLQILSCANIKCGSGNSSYGISMTNSTTGNSIVCSGAISAASSYGIYIAGNATIAITAATVTGSSTVATHGIYITSGSPTVTITAGGVTGGNIAGSYGVYSTSATATVTINGDVTAGIGAGSTGASNSSAGTMIINGLAIGNDYGIGSSGVSSSVAVSGSQTGYTRVRGLKFGSRGAVPVSGNVMLQADTENNQLQMTKDAVGTYVTMYRPDKTSQGQASPADVRYGTSYAGGNLTGTCHVPTAAQVVNGVAVDNTAGTAAITAATVTDIVGQVVASLIPGA